MNLYNVLVFGAAGGEGVSGSWDITSFLTNATTTASGWGGLLLGLIGTVAALWGAIRIAYGMMSERAQVSYPKMVGLMFVGGLFMVGGWSAIQGIAQGGQKTINDLGNGTGGSIWMFDMIRNVQFIPFK